MRSNVSRGFRALRPDDAAVTRWTYAVGDGLEAALPERDPDWSAHDTVRVGVEVVLDLDAARERLGLHATATLSVAILWSSNATQRRGASPPVRVATGSTVAVAEIPGDQVGGTLDLRTLLVVSNPGLPSNDPFAPRARHAIVWENSRALELEGSAPQLPLVAIPFSDRDHPPRAPWRLQMLTHELDTSIGSAFLLELNADHPTVVALTSGDETVSNHVLPLLESFVARALLHELLEAAGVREELSSDFEAGSLGAHVQTLLKSISGSTVEHALELYQNERGYFDLRVDSEIGANR